MLRTFAVPLPGVQVGAAVSLPDADPPLVADTVAKPPSVEQVALASLLFLEVALALQFALAPALESLDLLDSASATLPLPIASADESLLLVEAAVALPVSAVADESLLPVEEAVAVPEESAPADESLLLVAVAVALPWVFATAAESLFLVAFATVEPPSSVSALASLIPDALAFAFPETITFASHALPSVPVWDTLPEVDLHLVALASDVPALSASSSTDASPKSAKFRICIIATPP